MSERVQNYQFREDYRSSHYPFADTANRISTEYRREIVAGTFIDAALYPIGATSNVYLSQINTGTQVATISLSDRRQRNIATGEIDLFNPGEIIHLYDSKGRPAGVLVVDPIAIAQFTAWELGIHTFTIAQTEFVASCLKIPVDLGVRAFQTALPDIFAGDVYLLGEDGITLTVEDDVITVNAVGDPLFRRKECSPTETFTPPRFFLTVNNCPPDQFGNFNITIGDNIASDTIIRLVQTDGGLQIKAIGT
jgi:hypothetical protein